MNKYSLRLRNKVIQLDTPAIMGIINLTDDSFFAPSRCLEPETLGRRMQEMVNDGADILDLGAASSRPGSIPIPEKLERERIVQAMDIRNAFVPNTPVSIDTFRSSVACKALEKGAEIVNDISAARFDPELPKIAASYGAAYVLMHMKGEPKTMQQNPSYHNVVQEVARFFSEHIERLLDAGIYEPLLDPGFGFGKNMQHNFQLLAHLNLLTQTFNLPLLIGVSRKRMIQEATQSSTEESLPGSLAAICYAMEQGAHIVRVHDVPETRQVIQIRNQMRLAGKNQQPGDKE